MQTTYDSPAGSLPVVTAVNPPAVATGFNVYMGLSAETVTLQNATPIPVGEELHASLDRAGDGSVSGNRTDAGRLRHWRNGC